MGGRDDGVLTTSVVGCGRPADSEGVDLRIVDTEVCGMSLSRAIMMRALWFGVWLHNGGRLRTTQCILGGLAGEGYYSSGRLIPCCIYSGQPAVQDVNLELDCFRGSLHETLRPGCDLVIPVSLELHVLFASAASRSLSEFQTSKALPEGRVGEIWVTSKSRAAGYWSRPEKTKEDFGGRLADTNEVRGIYGLYYIVNSRISGFKERWGKHYPIHP